MGLLSKYFKSRSSSNQDPEKTAKAKENNGPRLRKRSYPTTLSKAPSSQESYISRSVSGSRKERAFIRNAGSKVTAEPQGQGSPKTPFRAARRSPSVTRFQTKTGAGMPLVESVVVFDSVSRTDRSRHTTADIRSEPSSTEPGRDHISKTRGKEPSSEPRDAVLPTKSYHSRESNQSLFPSSLSGVPDSKPLPSCPKSSRLELPKVERLATNVAEQQPSRVASPDPTNAITVPTWVTTTKDQITGSDSHKFADTANALLSQTAIISQTPRPNYSSDQDFPQTEKEAQEHITAIRNSKIEKSCEDLEHALDLLSNRLYQNTLHFLLELLQNADDNSYKPQTTPGMRITYRGGTNATLRFDTNETGFSRRDVEAICGIGNSSKLNSPTKLRQIGQKGIGFKSVFGVSDKVFIGSGHYSFMFSKGEPSGQLAPMWAQFPQNRLPGFSSIILRLRRGLDKKMLVESLRDLDGRHLMFLHKLKKIEIFLFEDSNKKSTMHLQRREAVCGLTGFPARIVEPGKFPPYALFRYPVSNLPLDDERKHQTESELVLAFPTNATGDNSVSGQKKNPPETHNVYAFLPIRDYGFKIILQADFVLIANREDIDSGSAWNKGLLENIPKAVLAAIKQFNAGAFRYSWLRYIPLRQETHDFFQDLWPKTQELLSREPILESAKGKAALPPALRYVPKKLADNGGRSIIPLERSKFNYVSSNYPSEASEALESLGVKRLSAEDFLHDLSNFITAWPNDFHHMPIEWHSQLSKILDSLTSKHEQLIYSLPIIPLRDGKWVPPSTQNLLFPLKANGLLIPDNLDTSVVHDSAANNYFRKTLLRKFLVQDAKETEICRIILETHASQQFEPKAIPIAALISHATFLYKSGRKEKSANDTLWVIATDGSCHPSRRVYMEPSCPDLVAQILTKYNNHFHFLHKDYYLSFSQDKDRDWLVEALGVAMSPRLVQIHDHKSKSYTLHDDFRFLIEAGSALDVLQLLKAHWSKYRPRIAAEKNKGLDNQTAEAQSEDVAEETSRHSIRDTLSSMTVHCCGGSYSSLRQTYLPRRSVLLGLDITSPGNPISQTQTAESECPTMQSLAFPLLDIPDPDVAEWDFLENFNVVVKVKAEHLISRLQTLKNTMTTKEQVARLYERLQAFTGDEDIGLIKRRFKEEHLVFIPGDTTEDSQTPRWVSTDDCVWDILSCLRRVPCLIQHYHSCEVLFCETIGLGPATYKTVIAEAKQIVLTDSLDFIRDVFKQLSHMSHGMNCETEFSELQAFQIFPISTGDTDSSFQFLKPAGNLTESNSWYISDDKALHERFAGRAPLLAFDNSTIGLINTLLHRMGCENRMLSKLAVKHATIEGWNELNGQYTHTLQNKWKYIARLVAPNKSNRITIIRQLRGIRVYQVQRIWISWRFTTPWATTIKGPQEKGRIKLATERNMLKIYLTTDDMKIGCPPPQLVQEISIFCGIDKKEHSIVLYDILVREDMRRLEENLKELDIPDDIPDLPELAENHLITAKTKSNKSQANEGVEDELNSHVQVTHVETPPTPGDDTSPEPISHPTHETKWGKVSSASKTTEGESDKSSGGFEWPFLSSPVLSMGGGSNYDTDSEQRMFRAELYVSTFLREIMGNKYVPKDHWTSQLRGRAKHKPFEDRNSSVSTFTIQDTSGHLKNYFVQQGFDQVKHLKENSTFHIQVAFTLQAVNSTFTIGTEQVKKAKTLSCGKRADTNIFILALVFNLDINPTFAIVADPWKLYHDGSLSLEAYSKYEASFDEGTEVFYVGKANGDLNDVNYFKYRSLKAGEIRLLELSPGNGDMQLRGTIHHVPIDASGAYWAISYVWGQAPKTWVSPSLETPDGNILLTISLNDVLKRLRQTGASIMLWADAICINQTDITEKGLQIRLMGDIYHKALRVVAWLGHEYDGSDLAIESLKKIRLPVPVSHSTFVNMNGSEGAILSSGTVSDWTGNTWAHINQLVDRDWFKRVWITQELVLGSDIVIMCGETEMDWDHFFEALTIYEKEINSGHLLDLEKIQLLNHTGPAYSLGRVRRRLKDEDRKHSLLELLELFAHTQATLECDKLFALLGLAHDSNDDEFNPDYDSTIEEIVRRYASAFVRRGATMELLYRSGLSKAYSFCSWIPRWTEGDFPQTISTWDATGGKFYAGRRAPPVANIGIPPALEVAGSSVDAIKSIHNIRMWPNQQFDSMADFQNQFKHLTEYPTGETPADVLLWLPIGNAKRPHLESDFDKLRSYKPFLNQEVEDWPDNFREVILSISPEEDPEKYAKLPRESQIILSNYWKTAVAFSKRLSNAVLCFTTKGYVGLCPNGTVADDEICLLNGGRVPFVLRKGDGESYTLVGECYIHGIMHGEALKLNPELSERRFRLV